MKSSFKLYSINEIKKIIYDIKIQKIYKYNSKDFTRNRKMTFGSVALYNLNKRGLTSKMEIVNFDEIVNCCDISSVGVLKQRKKFNGDIYKYIMQHNLCGFYNNYANEVNLYKGYIITATDGSDFEIPNTIKTRKNYNSTKENTSVARAHVSNLFDVLNHYVMSTLIGPENSDEKEMDRQHLNEIKKLNLPNKIIRTKDRGYVSLKDIYYSIENNDKFLTRLKKSDFKKIVSNMSTNDEYVDIPYQYDRIRYYKDKDPDFYNLMLSTKQSLKVRIVKIILSTGKTEILLTNLSQDEFSTEEIAELYKLRWQIETNYHSLKESLKIETITSSFDELIKQDIYSQMLVFNILQAFINDANESAKDLKYKHEMQVNFNMAIGFFKKLFILIMIEENKKRKEELLNRFDERIEKYLEPIRPNRNYPRNKNKKNKYSINKRKSF